MVVIRHVSPAADPESWERRAATRFLSQLLRALEGHLRAFLNSSGLLKGARGLLSAHSLLKLRQKSSGVCAPVFQSPSPFAASRGLVAVSDGHSDSKGKQPCPTREVSKTTPQVARKSCVR